MRVTIEEDNRDYEVLEAMECGIELKGCEVKSLRAGRINLDDSFCRIEEKEAILYNAHISPYEQASYLNTEPKRERRLLLHRNQINRLEGLLAQRGQSLVPLKVYFNDRGLVKIELGLVRGKRLFDKREDMKRREVDREIRRVMKNRRK